MAVLLNAVLYALHGRAPRGGSAPAADLASSDLRRQDFVFALSMALARNRAAQVDDRAGCARMARSSGVRHVRARDCVVVLRRKPCAALGNVERHAACGVRSA